MTHRWIYFFGKGQADGSSDIKHLIGGKGASLADMTRAGLNVPPGFTISAECCDYYYQHDRQWPRDLEGELRENLTRLEQVAGRIFGVGGQPLLLAVRSGAAQSMPGMMDTVLNVGLNPDCVRAMAERTGNTHGAWEAYLHFIEMFTHTVGGIDADAASGGREPPDSGAHDQGANAPRSPADFETERNRLRDMYSRKTAQPFPTDPWQMLRAAVNAVFDSWHSERAVVYRKHHHIDGLLGTAVNVQMMCPSEVSGVMFTANPVSQAAEVIIESAFGLGEAIVLGKVTPDRFVLHKDALTTKERVISRKQTRVATLAEDGRGQTGGKDDASLTDEQVRALAELGLRVESYFHTPCDIEWALSGGQFFLLQSRSIRFKQAAPAFSAVEREKVRAEEVAKLKALAAPGGTVWSRFNLSEVLPEPTPMTWAIVRQFMSGRGGYGQMYRDLGYDPDPALDDIGIFDLICGRPYCNLSREPRMQFKNMPLEHNFALLKKNPQKALYPQATFSLRGKSPGEFFSFFVRVPFLTLKTWWSQVKQRQLMRTFAERFEEEIVPPYLAEVEKAGAEDWSELDAKGLLERMDYWIRRTLFDFGRHSLKPTALAALLFANLERAFAPRLQPANLPAAAAMARGQERAQAALRELVIGVHADEATDLPAAIRALRAGRLSRDEFLQRFGHRGSQEMELLRPRWAEDHAALERLVESKSPLPDRRGSDDRQRAEAARQFAWLKLADEAKLMPDQRPAVEAELRRLQKYMGLRETAKHHLMRGYALIRRALVELDRRFELNGGIFFLTPNDLQSLVDPTAAKGEYRALIEEARRKREVALSLPAPTVIFSDDLDAIGREVAVSGESVMQGVPLSAGVVEATAWVLEDAAGAEMPHEPYILVCPSTDPAWVPLFVQARGLVMETGGMLSHGAIVAREFGLPAVAGIADVHRKIKTGQCVRIDGATGLVQVVA